MISGLRCTTCSHILIIVLFVCYLIDTSSPGIPEHATSLSLPTTAEGTAEVAPHYSEPYRLYNLDVFEYEIGEFVFCFHR